MEQVLTPTPNPRYANGMGRPPMNLTKILVRLRDGDPERIDALVGKRKRGEFIREAVEMEIRRREDKAVKDSDN